MEKAIQVCNVSKLYKLYNGSRERLLDLITPKEHGQDFHALRDVSFEADKGDVVGFIGINGSGKSTLSNIVAGIVPESSGMVKVNGQTALIAVSSGLKADLTGRDNIELKCLMLGFTKKEIKELEPEIIKFSELGSFIDQPVKSYSSGMKSRLGFAISVNVNPDVLIIDEALSVGDKAFAEKSLAKMMEFKEQGKTMIFVSHSIGQMKKFCEKILWLEYGTVKEYGTVDEVIPNYEAFLSRWKDLSKHERELYKKNVLEGKSNDDFFPPEEQQVNVESVVDLISRIGHIKGSGIFIYPDLDSAEEKLSSESYKHSSYYIKKQARQQDELYFLLSTKPSGIDGVIGWMKASEVASHVHIPIDNDLKVLRIKGEGAGFNRPWGGTKNEVIDDLKPFAGYEFTVDRTDKVGNNVWYHGTVNNQQVWIHQNHVTLE